MPRASTDQHGLLPLLVRCPNARMQAMCLTRHAVRARTSVPDTPVRAPAFSAYVEKSFPRAGPGPTGIIE
jgi:hypothetical protein